MINFLFTGSVILVITLMIYFSEKEKKDMDEEHKEAIRRKFSNIDGGWRLVKGVSEHDYLYIHDKVYKIVFSTSCPKGIVYVEELENNSEVIVQEKYNELVRKGAYDKALLSKNTNVFNKNNNMMVIGSCGSGKVIHRGEDIDNIHDNSEG